jgi:hypothetical protein
MVGKVLTGNGITTYGNGAYSLIVGDSSVKYTVHLCARGRCECFGACCC